MPSSAGTEIGLVSSRRSRITDGGMDHARWHLPRTAGSVGHALHAAHRYARVRSLALDTSSRTSDARAVRVCAAIRDRPPLLPAARIRRDAAVCDAALLIGDRPRSSITALGRERSIWGRRGRTSRASSSGRSGQVAPMPYQQIVWRLQLASGHGGVRCHRRSFAEETPVRRGTGRYQGEHQADLGPRALRLARMLTARPPALGS